ncbi:MAG TPA: SoxR reducing system RseC family protein [Pseudomonadales bacterium]|nr:SoxR reducing system RseC family protein [Pseudomonadales bacterium]
MIEETARIVAVEADALWIEARRESACGRCALRSGCGHSMLDGIGRRAVHLRLPSPGGRQADYAVGDEIVLGIDERAVLLGSVRLYALPLAGLLLGAVAGDALGGELGAVVAGALGLVAAFAAVMVLERARPVTLPRVLGRAPARSPANAPDSSEPRPISLV